jgi:hypothetical protein
MQDDSRRKLPRGVARVRMEGQIRRMAVVKLSVPDVVLIDEENREGAVGHVGDGTFPIVEMGELDPPVLVEVDLGVLEQEDHDLVACVVVDGHHMDCGPASP